ncbi:zinc carboxypeptidase-like [Anopheles moucheti]|uniref:zinc carboxypeptidase-like n=1 Tax=Anopheles moucheti TaxID=186751 RepID=UPI0022F13750|nr:zinc carboxypeptidase-like [Anopheles moucheti]
MVQCINLRTISSLISVLTLLATIICLPVFEANEIDIPIECLNETKSSTDYNIFDFFLTYDEASQWLTALATENPEKCQLQSLGVSVEGREINAISIFQDKPKKIVLIGNMYARHWVGMTSALYIIHELIRNAASYASSTDFHWIIVPMPNPDGYQYSKEHNRKWLKNRAPQPDGNIGVSIDNNFDIQWGSMTAHYNLKTTGQVYRGPSPFSEPETRAIKDLLESNTDALLVLNLQSNGRLICTSWSYTEDPVPDIDLVRAVAYAGQKAILEQSQQEFDVSIVSDYGPFEYGSCLDYCTSIGIKVCLILKQLDNTHEMMTDQIIPLGQEAFASILAMAIESDWQQWN